MKQYKKLIKDILKGGTKKSPAREGIPSTIILFGYQMRFDLKKGFPLVTTKPMYWKGICTELIWFLRGDTNIKYLVDNGCNIWNEDAYNFYCKKCKEYNINTISFEQFLTTIKGEKGFDHLKPYNYILGDCGNQYGKLWRNWDGVDQIKDLIDGLIKNPEGRRHIINAWNPSTLNDMALNACHCFVQFNCRKLTQEKKFELYDNLSNSEKEYSSQEILIPNYYLDCHLYQRSADTILGVPFNIASYSLLTEIIAKITGMIAGEFIHSFGDVHVYENHIDAANEILGRGEMELPKLEVFPRHESGSLPDHLEKYLAERYTLDDFINSISPYDFRISNYKHHPKLISETKLSTGKI